MQDFNEKVFFSEARLLYSNIDYDKKLESLESILLFERKWQTHYTAIKDSMVLVRRAYYDIIIMYLFLSEELTTEEETAFDLILEKYPDIELMHRGESLVL